MIYTVWHSVQMNSSGKGKLASRPTDPSTPVPTILGIGLVTFHCIMPQSQEKVRIIEGSEVHQIHDKYIWNTKAITQADEDHLFAKSCRKPSSVILWWVLGRKKMLEVCLVALRAVLVKLMQLSKHYIRVVTSCNTIICGFLQKGEVVPISITMSSRKCTE